MKKILSFLLSLSLIFVTNIFAEKSTTPIKLRKNHLKKIESISKIFANELKKKNIIEVTIINFTDFKGRELKIGKDISVAFRKNFSKEGFKVVDNSEIKIVGRMANFKDDKNKWKIEIKAFSGEKILTSYVGILKF